MSEETAISATTETTKGADDVAKLQKDVTSLKTKIAAATIAGLLFGGSGAFGVFTYFIEKPLKQENETLKAKISHAELDKRDLEQTASSYEKQIGILKSQMKMAKSVNASNLKDLQVRLEQKNTQFLQALENIERERQQRRQTGTGWFGR